jgi:hypothetical protein
MVVKTNTIFIFIFLMSGYAFSQNENIWAFGDEAGVDFNRDQPSAIKTNIHTLEGCASACDDEGHLLFYTDGDSVWNRNNTLMPNGINLGIGLDMANSTTQGALIVPIPGTLDKYYIFSLGSILIGYYAGRLFYSIVDMDRNNGLGDVGNRGIFLDSGLTEQMTAVPGMDCNIWLLVVLSATGTVKAYNIDADSIHSTPVQSTRIIPRSSGGAGSMDVSPDGTKLAIASMYGGGSLVLCDFDRSSGIASDPIVLNLDNNYGVCFSPDNSKLYVTSGGGLQQFDLSLGDSNAIINSRVIISSNSGSGYLKRGPDGKIYQPSGTSLKTINSPNLPGPLCQYGYFSLNLLSGTRSYFGLPNILVKKPSIDSIYFSHQQEVGCFATQAVLPLGRWEYSPSTYSRQSRHLLGTISDFLYCFSRYFLCIFS